ncbi:Arrestin (or S-antigen), N-terminal domain [Popillia japonica]|uniref:Arrestin (Or S-antigen), N-terminal domain n=1 Tax=Popillia japonica TaxID=7064 RepID=A0AAW1IXY7_POPJA
MGIRDFKITTNHPFNIYTAGQTVRGKVHFKLHTSKIVQGVYVRFQGIAQTQWNEERKHNDDKVTVRYRGEREYFDEILYLVGENNGESFELLPGEHNYKFEYALPLGLPTSFKGEIGSVIYTIKAVLDMPWDMPWGIDDEVETRIQVVSPIDLNKMEHLKKPGNATEAKDLCCLWCKSGPIIIEVHIYCLWCKSKTGIC